MPGAPRTSRVSTWSFFVLAPIALVGCAVGGPQIGPGTAAGYRTTTVNTKSYNGQTAASGYHYEVDQSSEHGDFGLGVMLGVRAGPTFVKVASAPSSGVGLADELHADFMVSWRRFGLGVEGTVGAEAVTIDSLKYSIGGFGASVFGQYGIAKPFFLTAGIGKIFSGVSRHTDDASVRQQDVGADDASLVRAYGRATLIFSDSDSTQWGAALELRYTASGDAMVGNLDLAWKSTALMAQVLFVKF